MKYAFMSFSCPDAPFGEALALARRLGYDGFEPRVESGHRHGIELSLTAPERIARRQEAEEAGIELCCLATGCRLAVPGERDAQVATAREYVQLAGDLGIPRLRVFGGRFGPDLERTAAMEAAVTALTGLAPLAAARGVVLCLETHDDWCHPDDVALIMERVDHPAVAVTWDMMHPVRSAGVSMEEAWRRLRPWVRHVHVHDGRTSPGKILFEPCGEGDFDLPTFQRCLRDMNYDGFISGEWIDCAQTIDLATELSRLKALEKAFSQRGGA
jgi:sugar phosphate isomerase/epimerase